MDKTLENTYSKYSLDPTNIPKHIAIIMDGNGRWAKSRNKPRTLGHQAGRKTLKQIIKDCVTLGIEHISAYAFSTENWNRPKKEVQFLMSFFNTVLTEETNELHKEGAKLKIIGSREGLSKSILKKIEESEEKTKNNSRIQVNVLLNYGSRCEIKEAVINILKNNTRPEDITEDTIADHLYTKGIPDPDILIRTGGDHRISNFLLWQMAYTELFIVNTYWPDFTMTHLVDIIQQFQQKERRYGGLNA